MRRSVCLLPDLSIYQFGQLGPVLDEVTPYPPPAGTGFLDVTLGDTFGVAIRSDGSLVAWGIAPEADTYGILTCPSGTDYISVKAGEGHVIALKRNGTIVGWGNTDEIGTIPTGVFTAIWAGNRHNIALKDDGTLVGFGTNNMGQRTCPSGEFVAADAGYYYSLGLRTDGSVVGWGYDVDGVISTIPKTKNFKSISAGDNHWLGLLSVYDVKVRRRSVPNKNLNTSKQDSLVTVKCNPDFTGPIHITFHDIELAKYMSDNNGDPIPVPEGFWPSPNKTFVVPNAYGSDRFGYNEQMKFFWSTLAGELGEDWDRWVAEFTYGDRLNYNPDALAAKGTDQCGTLTLRYMDATESMNFVFFTATLGGEQLNDIGAYNYTSQKISGRPGVDVCTRRITRFPIGRFKDRISRRIDNTVTEGDLNEQSYNLIEHASAKKFIVPTAELDSRWNISTNTKQNLFNSSYHSYYVGEIVKGNDGKFYRCKLAFTAYNDSNMPPNDTYWDVITLAFDDSSWTAAAGGIGYEISPFADYANYINTDVQNVLYNVNGSCFLRIPFTANKEIYDKFAAMTLRIRFDDGVIVYLNGVKVAEYNAPGTPAWDSMATEAHLADSSWTVIDLSAFAKLIIEGENILAIHAMNQEVDEVDKEAFLLDVELSATTGNGNTYAYRSAIGYGGYAVIEVGIDDSDFSLKLI